MPQQFLAAVQAMSNHPLMAAALSGGGNGGPSLPSPELTQQLMDSVIMQQQRQVWGGG
jgi:hypothetical protein